jgi:hypothetical protein
VQFLVFLLYPLIIWYCKGVAFEHAERECKLPKREQYIHAVVSKGDIRIIVTMLLAIAERLHKVGYLCIDFTYKRVLGKDINEWEIAGFLEDMKRREFCSGNPMDIPSHPLPWETGITLASLY